METTTSYKAGERILHIWCGGQERVTVTEVRPNGTIKVRRDNGKVLTIKANRALKNQHGWIGDPEA